MIDRRVVLRADASEAIGTGHVVRCQTLAAALVARGWQATVATRTLPEALADGLAEAGISVLRLGPDTSLEDEPAEITDRLGLTLALVVGDHYGLGRSWFEQVRQDQPRAVLMAIDDLADRPLPVDMVLNQNLGANAADYAVLVPAGARVLAGPPYALLRPEFADLRSRRRSRAGHIERILIFMSGADAADVTARAVVAIGRLGCPADVVVGAAYPNLAGLGEMVARQPATELHVNTGQMATLMDRADLAIGAASSASWERCTLGLPAVLVTLADNQVTAERLLVEAGAAQAIGWHTAIDAADIERVVRALIGDPGRVAAMSEAAARVTDGLGTERVVAAIEAEIDAKLAGS